MTTSEEVATTAVDQTDAGGYESTWLPLTTGYTTKDHDTTEQGGTTQTHNYTNHTGTTENTAPIQTTTIPREPQWNATTYSGTGLDSEFNNYSTTGSSTEYSTEYSPKRNRTLSQYATRQAVSIDQTTEQTTSSLPSIEGQTTPDRNDSTVLSAATSASPLLATWSNDTNNNADYINTTIIKQVNTSDGEGNVVNKTNNDPILHTSSWNLNNTDNSTVNNESYLILNTSSWNLNNTDNSTVNNESYLILNTSSWNLNNTDNSTVNNESYLILNTSSWNLNNTDNSTVNNESYLILNTSSWNLNNTDNSTVNNESYLTLNTSSWNLNNTDNSTVNNESYLTLNTSSWNLNNTDNSTVNNESYLTLNTSSWNLNNTDNSTVNDESYLILNTSSWNLNNTDNSTVENASTALSEETTKHHVKNTGSPDFEEFQSGNPVNITTTENSVESSSDEVTDQPVTNTTPLSLNESSTSFKNVSKDYFTEPVLHTVSKLPTSDELDPTSSDEFLENTTAPLYVGSTNVTVNDSTAIVAVETVTPEMFTESDSEIRTIEEADHAKTNRSEREVVPPHRPVTSTEQENDTYSTDISWYENTTLRVSNSTTSQPSPDAATTVWDESSTVSTEYVILAENVTPDPASMGNDSDTTTDASGYDDDNISAESGSQQTTTERPETITSDTSLTEALLDTPSAPSVPCISARSSVPLDCGSAAITTSERDGAITRSILLDTLLTASMHDHPETTLPTPETTDFDRHTAHPTTIPTPFQITTIHDLQFVTHPKNQSVQLGHTVVLECVTSPESDITWYVQPMRFCKNCLPFCLDGNYANYYSVDGLVFLTLLVTDSVFKAGSLRLMRVVTIVCYEVVTVFISCQRDLIALSQR